MPLATKPSDGMAEHQKRFTLRFTSCEPLGAGRTATGRSKSLML